MASSTTSGNVVLRSELAKAYRDPLTHPTLLAYIPEHHASSKCERALKGGGRVDVGFADVVWCDECTTTNPELATIRLINGEWIPTGVDNTNHEN